MPFVNRLRRPVCLLAAVLLSFASLACAAPEEEPHPDTPAYAGLHPVKAPAPGPLLLAQGDKLAICGDSITQQIMYSRLIEDYLVMCVPDLHIAVRQHGWSGETADGFLRRMKDDCLRFGPTIATLCYGMNDYRYRPYQEAIGAAYRRNYTAVVETFKAAGVKVVLGAPNSVGKVASWVKPLNGTLAEHNQSLCTLRNIALDIADKEQVRFADNFWPLFVAGVTAHERYGAGYNINGNDGVHPDWAGHLLMAYDYLKALGLDGDLGTIKVDLATAKAVGAGGHSVDSFDGTTVNVTSNRYPFCLSGAVESFHATRSGASLVPFYKDLDRLTLVVTGAKAANYKVTWGAGSKVYTAAQLAAGVNLAEDFADTPFAEAWAKVDAAVQRKEAFETNEMQHTMRSPAMKADPQGTLAAAEAERDKLVAAVAAAFSPVKNTVKIEAAP